MQAALGFDLWDRQSRGRIIGRGHLEDVEISVICGEQLPLLYRILWSSPVFATSWVSADVAVLCATLTTMPLHRPAPFHRPVLPAVEFRSEGSLGLRMGVFASLTGLKLWWHVGPGARPQPVLGATAEVGPQDSADQVASA